MANIFPSIFNIEIIRFSFIGRFYIVSREIPPIFCFYNFFLNFLWYIITKQLSYVLIYINYMQVRQQKKSNKYDNVQKFRGVVATSIIVPGKSANETKLPSLMRSHSSRGNGWQENHIILIYILWRNFIKHELKYIVRCIIIYLSISMIIYLSINMIIYLSINMIIYLPINMIIYLSINISIYLSMSISMYLSIPISIYLLT